MMANEFVKVSDGTFTLFETETPNEFHVYRNDGENFTDLDDVYKAIEHLYIQYLEMQPKLRAQTVYFIMSEEKKYITIIAKDIE